MNTLRELKCPECNKEWSTARALANHRRWGCGGAGREVLLARQRARNTRYLASLENKLKKLAKDREYQERMKNDPEYKKMKIHMARRAMEKYPEKYRARYMLRNAVAQGKIVKKPCIVCGISKTEGHHYKGYDYPLDVQWLCHQHHMMEEGRWIKRD